MTETRPGQNMKLITGEFTRRYLQSCSRNIYSDDELEE